MKILLLFTGKTSEAFLKEGIQVYLKRLTNYSKLSIIEIPISSFKDKKKAMEEESRHIQSKLLPGDYIIVLDEKGSSVGSRQLAGLFSKWMVQGVSRIVFVTGGPFGISPNLKKNANFIFSLSQLTFTHQMARLILVEQIYRAMTILKNESYHHD
jgi:23S rRNA (pseudouridine1915-N3)-methyltransferase